LKINELKVISFDRITFIKEIKLIEFDDQVRKYLDFMLHFLFKKQCVQFIDNTQKSNSLIAHISEQNAKNFASYAMAPFDRKML